jgi:hypothetical protein
MTTHPRYATSDDLATLFAGLAEATTTATDREDAGRRVGALAIAARTVDPAVRGAGRWLSACPSRPGRSGGCTSPRWTPTAVSWS